jgi:hypothetical protein
MPSFAQAVQAADPWAVSKEVARLRDAEARLRDKARARAPARETAWRVEEPDADAVPLPKEAAEAGAAHRRMLVATARLQLGAAVEAALADKALDVLSPGARPTARHAAREASRLYSDAHLVALWTSAHAEYVSAVQSGVEEPPEPGVFSVASAASEMDWSDLFSRRWCPRLCGSKAALPLLNVLMRST